ncbi:MAG: NAD(P)-dependent oxidoreductase [Candidatus Dormibacteraeota bacterium]|nr:NAD(P)-dependent oxidoreductase [Candidatus Dormibacteraeota bacterium]
MRIAITGAGGVLGRALMTALETAHDVRALAGDPRDPGAADLLLEDRDALIHLDAMDTDPATDQARDALDRSARGTYVLCRSAIDHGVHRVVVGSSLDLLHAYPGSWAVSEDWQPRPDVNDVRQLALHLTEQSARQFVFFEPLQVICLRFGDIVRESTAPGWTQVHVDDAVQAVQKALTAQLHLRTDEARAGHGLPHGWRVYHIPGAGNTRIPLAGARAGLGYAPEHDLAPGALPAPSDAERRGDLALIGPSSAVPSRAIRRVVVFGAGGPLGAATSRVLAPSYQLRLTDLHAIGDIIARNQPQSPGAPLPDLPQPPHESRQVDVTELGQVVEACEGMDAVINCTVIRPDLEQAFLVNCIGAYNVMRAAVTHRIRRVVHTGPLQVSSEWPAGYGMDFDVPDEAPGRAGGWLYGHSKFLGQELVRLFAEAYDLEVPALYFSIFVNPETAEPRPGGVHPMTISWDDAGQAMRRALEVPSLPSPFEIFHILADLPHGRYSSRKAQELLGWRPRDTLADLWARRADARSPA